MPPRRRRCLRESLGTSTYSFSLKTATCPHLDLDTHFACIPTAVATSMAEDTNKNNTPWDRSNEFQNDNAPYLAYVPGYTPLIITETLPNQFVEVYVIDNDEPINGPPFTFTLTNYSDLFKVRKPVFLGLLFFGVD